MDSGSTNTGAPFSCTNRKSGDSVSTNQHVNSKCEVENDATLSLLRSLASFQQQIKLDEQKTADNYTQVQPAAAEDEAVHIRFHPQMKSSNAAIPDLELTLAAPKSNTLELEQNKSSRGSFLPGPISVT